MDPLLVAKSGELGDPPPTGSDEIDGLPNAPGDYVRT